MEVVIARDDGQLTALKDDWLALQRAGQVPSPFQEWRWVEAWQRHFGRQGAQPLVLLVRDGSGPLALLPLQQGRAMGAENITWLSSPALQYGGMLMRPMSTEHRMAVLEALWRKLAQMGADVLDLPLLPDDDPISAFLRPRCQRGAANRAYRVDLSRYASWRDYELSLTPSARRARKKRLNKLGRAGALSFAVRPAGPDNVPALKRALAWKRGWLKAQGLEGALPLRHEFFDLLEDLFGAADNDAAGKWVVAELALDGSPISVEAGMILNGTYHSWFAAYDPDYSVHSPGKAGLWLMLQWCKEHDVHIYDMLANPAPYKEEWANSVRPLAHFVAPLSTSGHAHALWLTQGKPLARRLHGALPPMLRALVRGRMARLFGK